MLSTQYIKLLRRHFNQNTLKNVSRYLNDGQLDDFQKELTKEELKKAVADAASYDEKTGVDQVQWRSTAYHQTEAEFYRRPPVKPSRKENVLPSQKDDRNNSVILFPGQGTQFVGMGSKVVEALPSIKPMFESASDILGYNLLKICTEGPQELLNQTKYCQPAVVVTSLAAIEALYAKSPEVIQNCIATAGFSVGEITSLIFSGALTFEDGIRLIKVRAEAMEYASEMVDSGMLTVFYGQYSNLGLAMEASKKWVQENNSISDPVCQIANYICEGAKAIAGHVECLKFIADNKNDFQIRKVKWLPVSGAFHTPMMNPALEPFEEALSRIRISDPRIPVHSNRNMVVYTSENMIRKNLAKQIVSPVKWEQSMNELFRYERSEFMPQVYECGPGNSLTAILQKINGKVAKQSVSVDV